LEEGEKKKGGMGKKKKRTNQAPFQESQRLSRSKKRQIALGVTGFHNRWEGGCIQEERLGEVDKIKKHFGDFDSVKEEPSKKGEKKNALFGTAANGKRGKRRKGAEGKGEKKKEFKKKEK